MKYMALLLLLFLFCFVGFCFILFCLATFCPTVSIVGFDFLSVLFCLFSEKETNIGR